MVTHEIDYIMELPGERVKLYFENNESIYILFSKL